MNKDTITIDELCKLADDIASFSHRVERIADDAADGEISPEQATDRIREVLVALEDLAQVNQPQPNVE